jgi:hypothetical protein
MHISNSEKLGKFSTLRRLIIFNFAALVGFILGTISFWASMFLFPNPTFAWLFGNAVGGISHFGANYVMQGQSKKEITKCFVVFNATGFIGFLVASLMFAVTIIFINESTIAWFLGSLVGTMAHFVMNDMGMKIDLKNFRNHRKRV